MSDTPVSAFERIRHVDEHGEYWSARELASLLGYSSWQNFETAIEEAKAVCQTSGGDVADLPTANATHHESGDSVRALLLSKGITPEQLPTPAKSFQQLLREEEARQRILAENRLGLWGDLGEPEEGAE